MSKVVHRRKLEQLKTTLFKNSFQKIGSYKGLQFSNDGGICKCAVVAWGGGGLLGLQETGGSCTILTKRLSRGC